MFPIDKYAPKATNTVQSVGNKATGTSYPKLGKIPPNPENVTNADAAAEQLDKMMQESSEIEAKKNEIHGVPEINDNEAAPNKPAADPALAPNPDLEKPLPKKLDDNSYLLKRRNTQTDNINKHDADKPAGALANDAALLNAVAGQTQTQNTKQTEKKSFFTSLKDKLFKPAPKTVWRKSEPPTNPSRTNAATGDSFVTDANLPEINLPENNIQVRQPLAPGDATSGDMNSGKYYDNNQGSYLPKSRYTDRRKVPQHD